ncbi:MAG: hypothetical protein JXB34_04760 [Bacteroidales bacterium]|nr:hypothetical protein [Bacteroidales bacterium]
MKKHTLIAMAALLLVFTGITKGQYENPEYKEIEEKKPVVYFGLSTGINNFNGMLGGFIELCPAEKITIAGGLGLGMWGAKATGGLRYYKNYPERLYYSGSLSFHSGFPEITMEFTDDNNNIQTYNMKFKPVPTLNLAVGYQVALLNNKLRLHFEGGYAIKLKTDCYEVISGGELSDLSKQVMNIYTPGGLILGLGGSIGF